MNVKRISYFLVLVFVMGAGNVYAHDKGDLMLNIEPQIGVVIGNIGVKAAGIDLASIPGISTSSVGGDFSLLTTVHYYFVDFFGLNAGLGISSNYILYQAKITANYAGGSASETLNIDFANVYFTIPIGFRFSVSAFAVGAGLTANIPIGSLSDWWATGEATAYSGGMTTSMSVSSSREEDTTYKNYAYLGWYFDIGFDLSGIKDREGGFGMLLRLSGPLSNQTAGTNLLGIDYNPYSHFAVSLVFQAGIQLANLPIQ